MDEFHAEALRFGCLRGFKHFSLYLRGREELLVTVHHPVGASLTLAGQRARDSPRRVRPFDDDDGSPRARSRAASSVSSPFANSAPASTSKATTFLIGAYAKYDQPYAWLRSGAERDASDEQDLPLDLDATTRWKETRHRVWDVAEELVRTCVFPNPRNAFAVDHAALERLPRRERFLSTGALVAFLLELVRDAPGRDAERDAAVERDLVKLVETHLASTPTALERKMEGAEGTEAGGSLQASQATSGNAGK